MVFEQPEMLEMCEKCEAVWTKHVPVLKVRNQKHIWKGEKDPAEMESLLTKTKVEISPVTAPVKPESSQLSTAGGYDSKCINKDEVCKLKYFAGSHFMAQWNFVNTSPNGKAWPEDVTFKQISGDEVGVRPFTINASIANLAQANLLINLTAPNEPGSYQAFFRLCYGKQEIEFGERVWL